MMCGQRRMYYGKVYGVSPKGYGGRLRLDRDRYEARGTTVNNTGSSEEYGTYKIHHRHDLNEKTI